GVGCDGANLERSSGVTEPEVTRCRVTCERPRRTPELGARDLWWEAASPGVRRCRSFHRSFPTCSVHASPAALLRLSSSTAVPSSDVREPASASSQLGLIVAGPDRRLCRSGV